MRQPTPGSFQPTRDGQAALAGHPTPVSPASDRVAVLLVGTSETAAFLARAMQDAGRAGGIMGVVMAGKSPAGRIGQFPVLGALDDIEGIKARVRPTGAVVSLPSTDPGLVQRASSSLKKAGIPARFIAPPGEWTTSDAAAGPAESTSASAVRGAAPRIDVTELVGRTPYGIDRRAVARILEGKRVLVTGAGGSIGSELARIAATFRPEQLILMERAENPLFEIDRQLRERFPSVGRKAVLHDVVDTDATLRQLVDLKPHVIFHAAAHKHVPLMEDHPAHALTNNFFGTKSIADAALAVGVERFVMISSDKAVNPTSIMGATKRLAEMYIQGLHGQTVRMAGGGAGGIGARTRLSMVRFGNVLGSACSVLPIWGTQLTEGGPLTVTDARMTRYFMTIYEAAALVIQAAAIDDEAKAAAVYVLDMGEPVNILDLARRFVVAHGLTPRVAGEPVLANGPVMDITLTGIRPGEKLHEQLAYAAEQLRPTPYPGINAWAAGLAENFNLASLVAELSAARISTDRAGVIAAIRKNVPEMRPMAGQADQNPTEQRPDLTGNTRAVAA